MTDTLGTLTPEAKAYYDRKLLNRALPILALYKAGQQRDIPKNGGNQVSYRRFNALSTTSGSPLTEGTTPTAASLSVTEVTGTVAQYGNYVQVSDSLAMNGIDPVIRESTMLLGENAAQTVEEVIRAQVVTGTSVLYATGASRSSQSASNPISLSMVRKAVRTLEANDTAPFFGDRDEHGQGGLFFGFIHPRMWYDLIGDQTVLNTFAYSDPEKMYKMNIPELGQVAWVKTTKAPYFPGAGASGADVYGAIIVGQNAFGVVNVAGTGRFNTIAKPLGSAGSADPLEQRATIGWKSFQLPAILNNNFMVRIEAGVSS